MFVLATIAAGSASGPVKIRNLSPGGAMVEGAALPQVGDRFELRRGASCVCGTVAWCRDGLAGLEFDGTVDVAEWTPGGHAGQKRVDQVFQQVTAGAGAAPEVQILVPQEDTFAAPQLRRLARAIDALADDLADDAAVVAKFAAKLQTLDIASQVLRKLAERGS